LYGGCINIGDYDDDDNVDDDDVDCNKEGDFRRTDDRGK